MTPSGGQMHAHSSPAVVIAAMQRERGITGVHTHIREFRQFLAREGRSSTLVTPFSWGRFLTAPVFGPRLLLAPFNGPASVVWHRHWHEVFLRNALRRRLAQFGDCVVYAQGPLAARAALSARQGPHQRVIMAIHFRVSQADEWTDKKLIKPGGLVFRGIRQVEREVIPRLDGMVCVSRWARDALLSWLPEGAPVRYSVVPNFVSGAQFAPARVPLRDLVTVGNLELVKNHRFLLTALAEAKRLGRSLTLDVFGEGPCQRDLLRLTRSLGLDGLVRFHGFRSDVRQVLPRYRAYVHAAYSEACPLAIIEAMAAGLPIVAARIGPLAELFDDGVEGRLFPLGDPAEAAGAFLEVLGDEQERGKMARAARDRFCRDFDAATVAPQLLSFLQGTTPPLVGATPS